MRDRGEHALRRIRLQSVNLARVCHVENLIAEVDGQSGGTLSVPSEKDGAGVRKPVDESIDQASIDAGPPRAKSDTYRN